MKDCAAMGGGCGDRRGVFSGDRDLALLILWSLRGDAGGCNLSCSLICSEEPAEDCAAMGGGCGDRRGVLLGDWDLALLILWSRRGEAGGCCLSCSLLISEESAV